MDILLHYLFPLFGVVLIAFSTGAYLFKYGSVFKDKVQTFEGLGVKFQISTVMAIMAIGLIFAFTGYYFNRLDLQGQLDIARKQVNINQAQLNELRDSLISEFKRQNIEYSLILDSIQDIPPRASDLECHFLTNREDTDGVIYPLIPQGHGASYSTILRDVHKDIHYTVEIRNKFDHSIFWQVEDFDPIHPILHLKKLHK